MFLKEKVAATLSLADFQRQENEQIDAEDESLAYFNFYRNWKGNEITDKASLARNIFAWKHGYDDAEDLGVLLEYRGLSRHTAEVVAIYAAFEGADETVERILEAHPELREKSAVVGFLEAEFSCVEAIEKAAVNEQLGPLELAPLCYLLNSKYRASNDEIRAARLRATEHLLDLGSDPNDGMYETDTIRGFKTLLGSAVANQGSAEIAQILLKSGASIEDGPTLYEGSAMWWAVGNENTACLDVLIAAEPPLWHLCHALTHAIDLHNEEIVERLLEAGADPSWNQSIRGFKGNAMHEAIVVGGSRSILQLLKNRDVNLEFRDRIGRTPIGVATAMGQSATVDWLKEQGADPNTIRAIDKRIGEITKGDAEEALPTVPMDDLELEDHLWLHEAIIRGDAQLAIRLIRAGLDPFATSYDGNTALHLAVAAGQSQVCEAIISNNPETDIACANFDGETPLSLCCNRKPPNYQAIANSLQNAYGSTPLETGVCIPTLTLAEKFETAADAIAEGDVQTLIELLDQYPDLAKIRSIRPHRATLINYIGVNGFEGERQKTPENVVEVINLLVERGCDAASECFTYRGGPGENAIGLLTSSGVPPARLQLPMVHALVQGGATVQPETRFMVALYDACQQGDTSEILLDANSSREQRSKAMVAAIAMEQNALVDVLIDSDIDINIQLDSDVTALHQAAWTGNKELVDQLLERGADPTLTDTQFGGNAAGWAYANENRSLGEYLDQVIKKYKK